MLNLNTAKEALDKVIQKSRVHLYKPIQVAEILFRDRVFQDISLEEKETYRNPSKKWRDEICKIFLGRISTSSQKYQDDVFNNHATPPKVLAELGRENKNKGGIVESYIYRHFFTKYAQLTAALNYCLQAKPETFELSVFLDSFREQSGLKRSIDKIYEIVTYSLFSVLVDVLDAKVTLSIDRDKLDILKEFEEFAKLVLGIDSSNPSCVQPANLYRVGVTNAADRGLDMWANFGPAIQVKHLSLDEELADDIIETVAADRIIIVCKSSEEKLLLSVTNQLGLRNRIQGIITEDNLNSWYEKALTGSYSHLTRDKILKNLTLEIKAEFPAADKATQESFFNERGYTGISDSFWEI
ncbi:HaeII family restriction endonuclease [Planctomycetota bacterium]